MPARIAAPNKIHGDLSSCRALRHATRRRDSGRFTDATIRPIQTAHWPEATPGRKPVKANRPGVTPQNVAPFGRLYIWSQTAPLARRRALLIWPKSGTHQKASRAWRLGACQAGRVKRAGSDRDSGIARPSPHIQSPDSRATGAAAMSRQCPACSNTRLSGSNGQAHDNSDAPGGARIPDHQAGVETRRLRPANDRA